MLNLRRVSADFAGVVILAMTSLIVGLVLNDLRPNRLSLAYKTPEEPASGTLSSHHGPAIPVSTIRSASENSATPSRRKKR